MEGQPSSVAVGSSAGGPHGCFDGTPAFVRTAALDAFTARAMSYVEAGCPLHLRGPSGCGKTMLALHLARLRGRKVVLLIGDQSLETAGLVGALPPARPRLEADAQIGNVVRLTAEPVAEVGERSLMTACREGATLVYDAFNCAAPSANGVLLGVLAERLLMLPGGGDRYLRVHPDFRAILTSDPAALAGTHPPQNALLDRMVTLDLDEGDRDTEIAITARRAGLTDAAVAPIVDLVRDIRLSGEYALRPSLRTSIMIAQMARQMGLAIEDSPGFVQLCGDMLASRMKPGPDGQPDPRHHQMLQRLISHFCNNSHQPGDEVAA
jgi:nitric oxide reductase NorQ protein